MSKGCLYVVSAPSGAGKTSLVHKLVAQLEHIQMSVSHTTRKKRDGEKDGVHYHFVDVDTFQQMATNGDFLESAEVFGNYYGTSQQAVQALLDQGEDVILEIDWQGAQQVRRLIEGCRSIFILPPSKQALHDRLQGRGQDSEEIIQKRMAEARDEMSHFNEYDFLIINDDFDTALTEFKSIIISERSRIEKQSEDHAEMLVDLLK